MTVAAGSSVRTRVLDAAREAMIRGDWQRSRMADVAAAARVSRQTLYNEFGSKDALVQQLALREVDRFLVEVERVLDEHPGTPAAAVGEAVHLTLCMAADDPLVKAALLGEGALLPYLTTRGEAVLVSARDRMTSHLTTHWPDISTRDARSLGDIVVRLTVSHIVLPEAPSEIVAGRIADLVERLLGTPPMEEL